MQKHWRVLTALVAIALLLLSAASSTTSATSTPPPAHRLAVEYAPCPVVGVGVKRPRFSWSLTHPDRNASQSSYHITVTSSGTTQQHGATVVWDSGVVQSNATIGIQMATSLESDTSYTVSVVWTDHNGIAAAAASGAFTTALLDQADWGNSSWLSLPDTPTGIDTRNQFRANLEIPASRGQIARATCFVSGLGYHRSWLNGQRLTSTIGSVGGDDITLGPFLQFQRRVPYDTFDVTDMLHTGNNTLAVLLGRGWYALPEDPFTAVLGWHTLGPRSLRAICRVSFMGGGAPLQFETGDSNAWTWRHGDGELVSDHLFLGETIDKRHATPGWQVCMSITLDAAG